MSIFCDCEFPMGTELWPLRCCCWLLGGPLDYCCWPAGGVVLSPWRDDVSWLHVGMTRARVVMLRLMWLLGDLRCQIVATAVEMIATWKACCIWYHHSQQEVTGSMVCQLGLF
jgi:hypothetical protein